jgi:hypothetical protein
VGAKVGIGLVVGIMVLGLIGLAIYYWRRCQGTKESTSELHGEHALEKVHEMDVPREISELDDKAQIVAELHQHTIPSELPAESTYTDSLKELDTNERLDVIQTDARSRRRSDEIRLMRKNELEINKAENERENTQSPFDKLAREIRQNDEGVYRPSGHAPYTDSPEAFGLSRLSENAVSHSPNDENSLQRMITPPLPGESSPSESNTGDYRSREPISPIFLEGTMIFAKSADG